VSVVLVPFSLENADFLPSYTKPNQHTSPWKAKMEVQSSPADL